MEGVDYGLLEKIGDLTIKLDRLNEQFQSMAIKFAKMEEREHMYQRSIQVMSISLVFSVAISVGMLVYILSH
jgi:hypothetical protein